MVSLSTYFTSSVLLMISIILYACYTREQFYSIIQLLVSSKLSYVAAGNMIVACTLAAGRVIKYVFLGTLRDTEVEMLYDRFKYSITETLLALTIFRNELSPYVILFFGALLFIKSFHWLAKSRIDYLEQVLPASMLTNIRLYGLLFLLSLTDALVSYYCVKRTTVVGKTVLVLFAFEFGLLLVSSFSFVVRYSLHLIDIRMENGLQSKGLYIMMLDLFCEGLKCIIYVIFFANVIVFYGLPIHIVR